MRDKKRIFGTAAATAGHLLYDILKDEKEHETEDLTNKDISLTATLLEANIVFEGIFKPMPFFSVTWKFEEHGYSTIWFCKRAIRYVIEGLLFDRSSQESDSIALVIAKNSRATDNFLIDIVPAEDYIKRTYVKVTYHGYDSALNHVIFHLPKTRLAYLNKIAAKGRPV